MFSKITSLFKRKNSNTEKNDVTFPVFKRQKIETYNYKLYSDRIFETKVTKAMEKTADIIHDELLQVEEDGEMTLNNTIQILDQLKVPKEAQEAIKKYHDEIAEQQRVRRWNVLRKMNEIADTDYVRKGAKMIECDVAEAHDDVGEGEGAENYMFACNDVASREVTQSDVAEGGEETDSEYGFVDEDENEN